MKYLRVVAQDFRAVALSFVVTTVVFGSTGCSTKQDGNTEVMPSRDTSKQDTLRVLGSLPDFNLVDQSGANFGLSNLRGKVWVANFIFTRCVATCPRQTAAIAQLQTELMSPTTGSQPWFVSFSVDPDFDTPSTLAAYAKTYRADEERWKFVTGSRDAIWELSKLGFRLPVEDAPASLDMPIFHSPQFVIVDRDARIRGFYDGTDNASLIRLKQDIKSLLAQPAAIDDPPIANGTESTVPSTLLAFPYPEDVRDPSWLEQRRRDQLATRSEFEVFCDFRFRDMAMESGITFEHESVEYACKINIAAHYDHGNGLAVADVDGDGLLDIYFTTQIGANQLWKNLGNGKFANISTPELELTEFVGVSASFADTDNDGDPDLYVTTLRGGNRFFLNDGQGRFTDSTAASGLGYSGHSSSGTFFDYDRDGLVDLFLCNVGVFTKDQVDEHGIHPPLDDAFAGHLKQDQRGERSILYRNVGDNLFVDATKSMELIDHSWTGDACPIDGNGDGWPDLYVLNMQGNDEYYENLRGRRFERKSGQVFPSTSWGAMGIQVFDYDNDGKMDIFVSDMHSDMSQPVGPDAEKLKSKMTWPESFLRTGGLSIFGNTFFHNRGDGRYEEISDAIGAENYWPWGLSSGDLNADGYEDVFVASSMNYPFRYCVNSVLLNDRGKRFRDSEFILGVEPRKDGQTAKANFTLDPAGRDKNHPMVEKYKLTEPVEVWGALGSRSSAIVDLDNDGDLDIVTNEFNDGPMMLLSNLADSKSITWLKVRLVGKTSNRGGLGATVTVEVNGVSLTQVQDGKSGYLSQSDVPLYFGLDGAESVDSVVVRWPDTSEQRIAGPIEANQQLEITETEE